MIRVSSLPLIAVVLGTALLTCGTVTEIMGQDTATRVDHMGDPLPAGAKMRLGTTRLRMADLLECVAFSPDGQTLVSCGWDKSIRLWNVQTARPIRRLQCNGAVFAVAYSPDGNRLVSTATNQICMWNPSTGELLYERSVPAERVYGVAFTPDGSTFVTAGADEWVRIWDASSGNELLQLRTERGGDSHSVAISPDGHLLAAGSKKNIRIWNLAKGTDPIVIQQAHGSEVIGLAFSPDGKTLISSGYRLEPSNQGNIRSRPEVFLWRIADAERIHAFELDGMDLGHTTSLAVSTDGTILATLHHRQIVLWDMATREPIQILPNEERTGGRSHGLAISPDNRLVATTGDEQRVEMWDIASAKRSFPQPNTHHGGVTAIDTSPDGKLIVTSGKDGDVHMWDASTGQHIRKLLAANGWARSVQFFPDGRRVLATGDFRNPEHGRMEGMARLISISDAHVERKWPLPDRGMCTAISADGKRIAVALGMRRSLRGGAPPQIRVWDLSHDRKPSILKGHTDEIQQLQFDTDATMLLSTSRDGTIRKWNVKTGEVLQEYSVEKYRRPVLAMLRDWERLIHVDVAGNSAENLATGYLACVYLDQEKTGWRIQLNDRWPLAPRPSPDGTLLAVALDQPNTNIDAQIALIRMVDGEQVLTFELDDGSARSFAFSADGRTLYSGMDRGDVLVWDISEAYGE